MALVLDIQQVKKLQRTKRVKRMRRIRPPVMAEKLLRQKTEQLWQKVIFPAIARLKWAISSGMAPEQLTGLVDQELRQAQLMYEVDTETIVNMWRLAVDQMTRARLNAALNNTLGVDLTPVLDDPTVREALLVGSWKAEELIKTMPTKVMGQVAQAVMDNMRGVPLPEGRSLLDQIGFLGTRSRKWAHVIARDQTAKLTATLNQTRQKVLGVEEYDWQTMEDQRVVGNPTGQYPDWSDKHMDHFIMQGVRCRYDDSTVYSVDKGKTWKPRTSKMPKNHPSDDIMCRCYASPVIDLDKILAKATVQ